MITAREIIDKIDNLPPMPAIAVQLMEAASDPDVDMNVVASWIARDPGMTATLLKLCNSSFYGFSKKVSSIRQAAAIFGLNKITQLAVTALSSRYLVGASSGYALASGELWKHSITTASAAEKIAMKSGYGDTGLAFTAGLLHDIGKIIIHEYVGDRLGEIREKAETGNIGFLMAEREVLGFGHSEVGAMLMEKWNFPNALVDAIRYHHNSEAAETDVALARIVQMADAVSMTMGLGLGADGLCYNLPKGILDKLGISDDEAYQEVIIYVAEKIKESPEALLPPRDG